MSDVKHCRLLILGSPCQLGAGGHLCGTRQSQPVLVTGIEQGGQLMTTTEVENWPGGDETPGTAADGNMRRHAGTVRYGNYS
jgi:thioredoxin reductase (NADPH)